MIGDVEWIRRFRSEALSSVPSHVLNHEKRAVRNEDHIKRPMANNSSFASLNNSWENAHARWRAVISAVDKHSRLRAFFPIHKRSIDSFLDIGSVEVYTSSCGKVSKRAGESQDIPQYGTGGGYLVYVPTWIDIEYLAIYGIKNITTFERVTPGINARKL